MRRRMTSPVRCGSPQSRRLNSSSSPRRYGLPSTVLQGAPTRHLCRARWRGRNGRRGTTWRSCSATSRRRRTPLRTSWRERRRAERKASGRIQVGGCDKGLGRLLTQLPLCHRLTSAQALVAAVVARLLGCPWLHVGLPINISRAVPCNGSVLVVSDRANDYDYADLAAAMDDEEASDADSDGDGGPAGESDSEAGSLEGAEFSDLSGDDADDSPGTSDADSESECLMNAQGCWGSIQQNSPASNCWKDVQGV